ncbi:MAG: hypothetical protein AAGE94_08315 [Acidobacteriota bacterium]
MTIATNDYPQAFTLPRRDVTAPSGYVFGADSQEARAHHVLAETARRGHAWQIARTTLRGRPGWVPAPVFTQPWSCGMRGTRCVRDLRKQGFRIPEPTTETTPQLQAAGIAKLTWYRILLTVAPRQTALLTADGDPAPPPSPDPIPEADPDGLFAASGIRIVLIDDGDPIAEHPIFGQLDHPVADGEAYRQALRQRFAAGDFSALGSTQLSIADARTVLGVDPLPVLRDVLPRLGITLSIGDAP